MERDIIGELNAYYNSLENQYQMQKQQKKMSLEQIQELANCIKVLGNALCFAENYSIMNGNKSQSEFTNYDYYYASKNTEKSLSLFWYISKYNSEPLPKSLTKSDIILRLKKYSHYAKSENEKAIYQDFINALDRKSINNVNKVVKNFKGPGTMNPEKIKDTFIEAKGYVDEENDEVMKEAENNPDYEPDIKLNRKKIKNQKN